MAFAAALLLVPAANAQTNPPYILDATSGYAYNKYLTSTTPNANGEYTVHIETFATGSVKQELKTSDIIIVLDMSGSMRYDYYTGYPSAPNTVSGSSTALIQETGTFNNTYDGVTYSGAVRYTYMRAFNAAWRPTPDAWIHATCYNAEGGTARYYKYSGTYYRVRQEYYNDHYFLYFIDGNGTKRYLWRNKQQTTRPTGTTVGTPDSASNAQTIYFGNLYRFKTRLEVLQDAVVSFMEAIKTNSEALVQQGKSPNRIALVQFSGMSNPSNSLITSDPGTITISGTEYVDHTFVRRNFTQVTASNATSIENSIKALKCDGETPVHAGMRQARLLLQGDNTNNNKFVVVFTDGEPRKKVGNSTNLETFYSIASKAMADANQIRNNLGTEIFAMALGATSKNKTFLQHLSSLYLGTVSVTSADGGDNATYSNPTNPDAATAHYYQDDATSDFTEMFNNIAAHIIDNGATSVASIDLITPSFQLPSNVNPNRVNVYTAPCTGESGGYLTFGSAVKAPNRGNVNVWVAIPKSDGSVDWVKKTMDIDNNITINTDAENDQVTVGGFDYATLWCGPDEEHGGYHGYKLIFEFPIVISDDAVGGPNVPTNLGSSGLYPIDDQGNVDLTKPIIKYPIPELTIPIKLIIQKSGLNKGESASFTVERRLIGSSTWEFFTSFVLTGNGSTTTNPEVRLLSLDPNYYYRVKETGWSWAYRSAPPTYTSTEQIDPRLENPIVFTNTPKTDVPKHAEAKSVNTMKETTTEGGSTTETIYD